MRQEDDVDENKDNDYDGGAVRLSTTMCKYVSLVVNNRDMMSVLVHGDS